MTIGIFITSYNRCEELATTCREIAKLNPAPDEVLICLDGCTDGSFQTISRMFPAFGIIENQSRLGSVPSRDRGFRLIHCEIVVSLDDDSAPIETDFTLRLKRVFDRHPEAAVITFSEIRDDGIIVGHSSSRSSGRYLPAFANCGAAYRRRAYGTIAAFSTIFEHMYEEPDYALQCYAAGWGVWYEPTVRIRHRVSPNQRNVQSRQAINARNEFLSVMMRCPMPYAIPVAAYRIVRQLFYAAGQGLGWVLVQHRWVRQAAVYARRSLTLRRPIPWSSYRAWMLLTRNPIIEREDLAKSFGHCCPLQSSSQQENLS